MYHIMNVARFWSVLLEIQPTSAAQKVFTHSLIVQSLGYLLVVLWKYRVGMREGED